MATTNFVRLWRDGARLFVDVNGATIEASSLEFDERVVTLQFQAIVTSLDGERRLLPSTAARLVA